MKHIIFFLSALLSLFFNPNTIEDNLFQCASLSVTKSFSLFEANTNKLSFLIYSCHGNDLSTFEVTISEKQLYIVTISTVGIKNVYAAFSAEDIL